MSSFVTIELDTSPPQLEIYTPSSTNKVNENHITIEANEDLGTYQEIYIIDSNGNRHNYTFQLDGNRLFGSIVLNDLSLGLATFYVKVNDVVDNVSFLNQKEILIKENITRFRMDISHSICPISLSTSTRGIELLIEA